MFQQQRSIVKAEKQPAIESLQRIFQDKVLEEPAKSSKCDESLELELGISHNRQITNINRIYIKGRQATTNSVSGFFLGRNKSLNSKKDIPTDDLEKESERSAKSVQDLEFSSVMNISRDRKVSYSKNLIASTKRIEVSTTRSDLSKIPVQNPGFHFELPNFNSSDEESFKEEMLESCDGSSDSSHRQTFALTNLDDDSYSSSFESDRKQPYTLLLSNSEHDDNNGDESSDDTSEDSIMDFIVDDTKFDSTQLEGQDQPQNFSNESSKVSNCQLLTLSAPFDPSAICKMNENAEFEWTDDHDETSDRPFVRTSLRRRKLPSRKLPSSRSESNRTYNKSKNENDIFISSSEEKENIPIRISQKVKSSIKRRIHMSDEEEGFSPDAENTDQHFNFPNTNEKSSIQDGLDKELDDSEDDADQALLSCSPFPTKTPTSCLGQRNCISKVTPNSSGQVQYNFAKDSAKIESSHIRQSDARLLFDRESSQTLHFSDINDTTENKVHEHSQLYFDCDDPSTEVRIGLHKAPMSDKKSWYTPFEKTADEIVSSKLEKRLIPHPAKDDLECSSQKRLVPKQSFVSEGQEFIKDDIEEFSQENGKHKTVKNIQDQAKQIKLASPPTIDIIDDDIHQGKLLTDGNSEIFICGTNSQIPLAKTTALDTGYKITTCPIPERLSKPKSNSESIMHNTIVKQRRSHFTVPEKAYINLTSSDSSIEVVMSSKALRPPTVFARNDLFGGSGCGTDGLRVVRRNENEKEKAISETQTGRKTQSKKNVSTNRGNKKSTIKRASSSAKNSKKRGGNGGFKGKGKRGWKRGSSKYDGKKNSFTAESTNVWAHHECGIRYDSYKPDPQYAPETRTNRLADVGGATINF